MSLASPLSAEMDNLDMEAVARVARAVELREIHLLRAAVSRPGPEPVQGRLVLDFDCSTRLLEAVEGDHLLPVACDFSLTARNEEEPQREVMRVEATFLVSYEVAHPENLSMDDLHHFARINPLYNAWSYWREFVHSMTTRMGLPPLLVPLLKIGPRKAPAPPPPAEKKRRGRQTKASS
ncbi:MAG: hypothetical protein WHT07_00435 [Desulfobaccales bacterium]